MTSVLKTTSRLALRHQTLMSGSEALGIPPMRPRVLVIGSEDVDARIGWMRGLAGHYDVAAAGTSPELVRSFAQHGFPYYQYPLGRGLGVRSDLCALVALWRVIKTFRPHVVHAFDTKPGVYGCLAARLAGVPVVVGTVTGLGSLYAGDGSRLTRAIYERMQRLASGLSELTIFQNREDREQFLARAVVAPDKAALIPGSGVATDRFDPALFSALERRQTRASLGIAEGAPLVTMVARVIRSKGVQEFVSAAARVRQLIPGSHFLLVGRADKDSVDSFEQEELTEFARVVHWPGPRREIAALLAASDVFALPSYLREGIPRSLLEAAAMGLPLVTTDTPGCNDVVEHGVNGFLVPARDSRALAEAIVRLIEEPEQRRAFGRISRTRAVERFDLAVVIEQTHRHYQKLLARKAPACISRNRPRGPWREFADV